MPENSKMIEPVSFQAGDILFSENDRSYHFFIIHEGKVEVSKSASAGEKVILATVGPGFSVGEFAMIDRLPRSATARALTNIRATKINEAAYKQLLDELPDWAVSVMRALVDRLRATNEIARRALTDSKSRQFLDQAEYDSAVNSNPMLGADDDETPDLA